MSTAKTVYFVRHGESADNISPVFQSPDSPLSDRGRKQAEMIAARARTIAFEAFITSPYRRAAETAEAIAKATGKRPEESALFVERMKPARVNGSPHTDEEAARLWREWNETLYTPGVRVADGENFDDIMARAEKAMAFLEERPERSVLVVTHGYFLRALTARILLGDLLSGEALRRFQKMSETENAGLTVLRYREKKSGEGPRWNVWIYNDHAHLAE